MRPVLDCVECGAALGGDGFLLCEPCTLATRKALADRGPAPRLVDGGDGEVTCLDCGEELTEDDDLLCEPCAMAYDQRALARDGLACHSMTDDGSLTDADRGSGQPSPADGRSG